MKILIPILSFGNAGGYRVLSELASHWTDAGHEVDFLVDIRSNEPYFPTRANVIRFGKLGKVAFTDKPIGTLPRGWKMSSVWLGMLLALNRIGAQYDIILSNQSLTTYPVAFARTGTARKWYYIQAYEPEYYSVVKGWRARMGEILSLFSYKLNLRQITNSPIYLGYKGIRASRWIPPGIDPVLFRPRECPPTFDGDLPIVIGTIGRKELTKGTADVLKAFELLAAQSTRFHLNVAFGNLPPNWTHPRADIVTPKNDAELAAWYRSVDVLIAPGTVQLGACHYPVLEAMASGTPVITTGYLPADKNNAWIVPVHAPQAIVDAVQDIIDSGNQRVHAKTQLAATAISQFYWKTVAANFLRLFATTL